jgi:hypothetical protein
MINIRRIFQYTALIIVLLLALDAWISLGLTCQKIGNQSPADYYSIKPCGVLEGPFTALLIAFADFFERHGEAVTAAFTIVLAVSTVLLWWSTNNLWVVTKRAAERQQGDTEILHRAYVSAELLGVEPMHDKSKVIAHVDYRNVGHLPAREFQSSFVHMKWTPDDNWGENALNTKDVLEYKSVLPVQGKVTAGANNNVHAEHLAKKGGYIWVWGILTYTDGFSPLQRYTKFCHRYPCAQAKGSKCLGFSVDARYGRYHHHGNEAD